MSLFIAIYNKVAELGVFVVTSKQTAVQPSVFLAHGSPMLAITDTPANRYLRAFGSELKRPRGIVVMSPHWETEGLHLSAPGALKTIHDFRGFPDDLFQMEYPAAASPDLVGATMAHLEDAGVEVKVDGTWGLDHGAWIPLSLAFPAADIPVAALSVPYGSTPASVFAIGKALAPLREKGILIAGSGSTTHNLRAMNRNLPKGMDADWPAEFDHWLDRGFEEGGIDYFSDLTSAPHFRMAHPTEEHLLPLFFAYGAGGDDAKAELLHRSYEYGTISMSYFRFAA